MSNLGKPIGDKVLIKLENASEKKSSGGIILNQTTLNVQTAKVVAVSDGFIIHNGDFVKLLVKEGDTILVQQGTGTKIRLEGQDYQLIKEQDILMILNNNEDESK